jgi:hypothetical protein
MQLIKGQNTYKISEPIGSLVRIIVNDIHNYILAPVSFGLMSLKLEMKKPDMEGRPEYYCLIDYADTLLIHPTPDKNYEAEIFFYPPMKII